MSLRFPAIPLAALAIILAVGSVATPETETAPPRVSPVPRTAAENGSILPIYMVTPYEGRDMDKSTSLYLGEELRDEIIGGDNGIPHTRAKWITSPYYSVTSCGDTPNCEVLRVMELEVDSRRLKYEVKFKLPDDPSQKHDRDQWTCDLVPGRISINKCRLRTPQKLAAVVKRHDNQHREENH